MKKRMGRNKQGTVYQRDPDEIRDIILRYLYERHKQARGVEAQKVRIRDLQRKMKELYGLSQQEVASNLDYLVQRGWVREVRRPRTFTTRAGTVRSAEQIAYKISDAGIDHIEGESRFKRVSPFSGVNISNVQGAVVIGNQNVVHNEFVSLSQELESLRQAITKSSLSDREKVDAIAEVQTIQSQLAKRNPNPSILRQAWEAIERIATLGNFAEVAGKVKALILPFLSGGAG